MRPKSILVYFLILGFGLSAKADLKDYIQSQIKNSSGIRIITIQDYLANFQQILSSQYIEYHRKSSNFKLHRNENDQLSISYQPEMSPCSEPDVFKIDRQIYIEGGWLDQIKLLKCSNTIFEMRIHRKGSDLILPISDKSLWRSDFWSSLNADEVHIDIPTTGVKLLLKRSRSETIFELHRSGEGFRFLSVREIQEEDRWLVETRMANTETNIRKIISISSDYRRQSNGDISQKFLYNTNKVGTSEIDPGRFLQLQTDLFQGIGNLTSFFLLPTAFSQENIVP